VTESKNPGVAALLAFLVGIAFMGVGHIYVGKIGRGIVLLIAGLALRGLAFMFILGSFITVIAIVILSLAVWVWQTYDAYKLAKQFNAHVQQHGKAPW
jgi:TM2 domain-containing membrane protein YozV